MNLEKQVKSAAKESDITGVLAMSKKCGLTYPKTRRIWEGGENASVEDVRAVLQSLGYDLAIVEAEDQYEECNVNRTVEPKYDSGVSAIDDD